MSILKTVKLYTVNGQTVWLHKLYFYTSMNLKNVLIPGPNPSQLGMKLMMKPAAMNVPPLCLIRSQERNIPRDWSMADQLTLCLSCRHVTRSRARSTSLSLHVRPQDFVFIMQAHFKLLHGALLTTNTQPSDSSLS